MTSLCYRFKLVSNLSVEIGELDFAVLAEHGRIATTRRRRRTRARSFRSLTRVVTVMADVVAPEQSLQRERFEAENEFDFKLLCLSTIDSQNKL